MALYWAHPGAWWIARRLRIERELACDDCVLSAGTDPRGYAGHLLELAYSLGGYRAPALVVSMARPRQLEGRLLAILDATRNRATLAASGRLRALAIAAVVTVPLATATTVAHPVASPGQAPSAPAGAPANAVERSQHPGTWVIRPSETPGRLELTLNGEHHSFYGTTVPIERLEGITPALLSGRGGLVTFNLRRDAGIFTFEGVLRAGVGGGTYDFAASTTFSEALARRGFARPMPAAQYALALADVGFAFLDELSAQKYTRPDLAQLVNAVQHGVSADYVRQMGQLGYRLGSVDALIRQRDHGVSPDWLRKVKRGSPARLSIDELVNLRDHGVDSPEAVRGPELHGWNLRARLDALFARWMK